MDNSVSTPRDVANNYVFAKARIDPATATMLGFGTDDDRLPDLSPTGLDEAAELARHTLAELSRCQDYSADSGETRCAKLLRERLTAELALYDTGEHLRSVRNMGSPLHVLREMFIQLPKDTDSQWVSLGQRLARFGTAVEQYRMTLTEGVSRSLVASPRQVTTVAEQLRSWTNGSTPAGWFGELISSAPDTLQPELGEQAMAAAKACNVFRDWLVREYGPACVEQDDAVGPERYRHWARYSTGAELDLDEAFGWAWDQFHTLHAEMRAQAEMVSPGSTPLQAMAWLDREGPAIDGVDAVRDYLQAVMDKAMSDLQGTHFDLADRLSHVEAMIAPAGTAAAPYYTPPSYDFSRPGRTWLPTLGRTRFPVWDLLTTWYHEGVPGHHLQIGQSVEMLGTLSAYQISLGWISANLEGWALYAERLMDELGYLDPPARMGYLNFQMLRVLRVILDIGLHTGLSYPTDSPYCPGELIRPDNAREMLGRYCGLPAEFLDSELVRYLGAPGQAIGYKLGERAWLAGRSAAEAVARDRGRRFDLKSWHMNALSLGSLGLEDLVLELARLG